MDSGKIRILLFMILILFQVVFSWCLDAGKVVRIEGKNLWMKKNMDEKGTV